ncbi:hypothetical protein IAQ61_002748 [Plenodomus lingam]|uniref:uncharacterized protein n=1 Tax=Leptosphaeria maculans TaxID=5022 RepID=UPI0033239382|nr:hypothetical protein IAQ61_002748 [Plenodomus lingam]
MMNLLLIAAYFSTALAASAMWTSGDQVPFPKSDKTYKCQHRLVGSTIKNIHLSGEENVTTLLTKTEKNMGFIEMTLYLLVLEV